MTESTKTPWLKIIGWAVAIHLILIALTILEVAIYSMAINPGQEQAFYEQHAQMSGPYISIIFGIMLFFLIGRLLSKKQPEIGIRIALLLAIAYIVLDLVMLLFSEVDWGAHTLVFIVSIGSKVLAGYAGAWMGSRVLVK